MLNEGVITTISAEVLVPVINCGFADDRFDLSSDNIDYSD